MPSGTGVILKRRSTPYVNAETIGDYIHTMFWSNLTDLHNLEAFPDADVVI
jgi:hypothetical protein